MYWYVSTAKIDSLSASAAVSLDELKKLKLGPFEFEGKLTFTDSVRGRLQQVCDRLEKSGSVGLPDEIAAGDSRPYVRFSARAARIVDPKATWCAFVERGVAVLLVGSSSHVIGGKASQSDEPSPSADPAGSCIRAFANSPEADIAGNLSYVWQHVYTKAGGGTATLPVVEGIALFGGLFPANAAQLRRAKQVGISKLLLASPIYVSIA